jgi:hypothetical protein
MPISDFVAWKWGFWQADQSPGFAGVLRTITLRSPCGQIPEFLSANLFNLKVGLYLYCLVMLGDEAVPVWNPHAA